jgi:hypothetical protein
MDISKLSIIDNYIVLDVSPCSEDSKILKKFSDVAVNSDLQMATNHSKLLRPLYDRPL